MTEDNPMDPQNPVFQRYSGPDDIELDEFIRYEPDDWLDDAGYHDHDVEVRFEIEELLR